MPVLGPKRLRALLVVCLAIATPAMTGCLVNQDDISALDRLSTDQQPSSGTVLHDIRYGPNDHNVLDVHVPAGTSVGIVIYLHSGGWVNGHKEEIEPMALSLVDRGFTLVSADYRLVPGADIDQIGADIDRLVRFVKLHRVAWGADEGGLILSGSSAGGHLALLAATAPGVFADPALPADLAAVSPEVDAVYANVGPTNLLSYVTDDIIRTGIPMTGLTESLLGCSADGVSNGFEELPLPKCDLATPLRASPLYYVVLAALKHTRLPDAYIACGTLDPIVPPRTQCFPAAEFWQLSSGPDSVWYDQPPDVQHNISHDMNATAFWTWADQFAVRP